MKKCSLLLAALLLLGALGGCAGAQNASPADAAGGFSAAELDALRAQGKTFVVYFSAKQTSDVETTLQEKLALIRDDYADKQIYPLYTLPLADYPAAKDILGGNLFGLVLFRPEGDVVLSGDSKNDVGSAFNRFFEYELVQPDDHGLPVITYAELTQKIADKENCLIYIGRDTCPSCRAFIPNLMAVLESAPPAVPVYYFYTQTYNTAINQSLAGAQEEWQAIKDTLGFASTPALFCFKDGQKTLFNDYNTLLPAPGTTEADLAEDSRLCQNALNTWFALCGITQ